VRLSPVEAFPCIPKIYLLHGHWLFPPLGREKKEAAKLTITRRPVLACDRAPGRHTRSSPKCKTSPTVPRGPAHHAGPPWLSAARTCAFVDGESLDASHGPRW